jgi:hypothetical protein
MLSMFSLRIFKYLFMLLLFLYCISCSVTGNQQAQKLKDAYLNYRSDYKSVRLYDDFFNPQCAEELLSDAELLDFFTRSVKITETDFSDVAVYEINKLNAEDAEVAYVMLMKKGTSIDSILSRPYGLDMMLILHYNWLHAPYDLNTYRPETRQYMQRNAALFFRFDEKNWKKTVQSALSRVNSLNKAQTETLLYLLLEFPLQLPETEFAQLTEKWCAFHPEFAQDIRLMQHTRNQLAAMLTAFPDSVGVSFTDTTSTFDRHSDWLRYLFALTGKRIYPGKDFVVSWNNKSTLLREAKKNYTTTVSTQKAGRHWMVGYTGVNPKMDVTYYERMYSGIIPALVKKEFKVVVNSRSGGTLEFAIDEIITNKYYNVNKQSFSLLSAAEMDTQRTWLLGVAMSYFTGDGNER